MILEFGLGRHTLSSFPGALRKVAGPVGEAAGWWGVLNALIITMYYITILGWVTGMWWYALAGSLWEPSVAVPAFGMKVGDLPNPFSTFFDMLSGWHNVLFVAIVWALNIGLLLKGTKSIEAGVKVMMPLMWVFMLALVVRGLTLDGGMDGAYLLFSPDFSVIVDPAVWKGAFSQIFFTLSLGFGIMTTYASYLPKKSDHVSNALVVSCLNCSFEMIAGLAVFSMLFAFALTPKASTIAMMFFIVPAGIAQLPMGVQVFGVLFFTLLLLAGLSSSISLLEAMGAALIEKFHLRRAPTLLTLAAIGMVGSLFFALPTVINKSLSDDGTLGLTLLDLVDHYAFSYGLIIVGLLECIVVGWVLPVRKLRQTINEHAAIKLGGWFDVLIKFVIPALLSAILVLGIRDEIVFGGLYGSNYDLGGMLFLPAASLVFWLVATGIGAAVLATLPAKSDPQRAKEDAS
jgi:NSS family neurotransmitter:Na+ symporter